MKLRLRTLVFDRETLGRRPAAIPVRPTRFSGVPRFDWERKGTTIEAPAVAYPIALTADDVEALSVTVTFSVQDPPTRPVVVRARDRRTGLMGDVVDLEISPVGLTRPRKFRLTDVHLREAAVGEHGITWEWEVCDAAAGGFQPFDTSTHRVFTILGEPVVPWGRPTAPRTIVPWDDITALYCLWAEGQRTPDDVMTALTAAVDALAGKPIGCQAIAYQGFGSFCVGNVFHTDEFLSLVHGQWPAPWWVNCEDLNTAIALGATLLGSPLRLVRLSSSDRRLRPPAPEPMIRTNPIRLFGQSTIEPTEFLLHEVAAIPGGPIDERRVWDACLRIDMDPGPQQDMDLSVGLTIAENRRDLGYRRRLLIGDDQDCRIVDICGDGLRYPGSLPPGVDTCPPDPFFDGPRNYFASLMRDMPNSEPISDESTIAFATWLASAVDVEGSGRPVPVREGGLPRFFRVLRGGVVDGGRFSASLDDAESREQAVDVFLTLAAKYTGTLVPFSSESGEGPAELGDFALQDPAFGVVLMLRGRVVIIVHGTTGPPEPAWSALTAAKRVDDELARFLAPKKA